MAESLPLHDTNVYLVVMAGGSGTRFWPKSTAKCPKQLLNFQPDSPTLLIETLNRFKDWIPDARSFVLTTHLLAPSIREMLVSHQMEAQILAEPQSRNTAPCLYWAAQILAEQNPEALMIVMPSDHYIGDTENFITTVKKAATWAQNTEELVTLGIQPTRPETGYGYLQTEKTEGLDEQKKAKKVLAFIEKPSLPRAQEFFQSKNYLWNGGMFLWKVSTLLAAFDEHMPEMKRAWEKNQADIHLAYPEMPATSIDYGIMEKAKQVVTFPLLCGWDDLGSWTSLEQMADFLGIRQGENVLVSGDLLTAIHSRGNIVDLPGRQVALLQVQDLIVVEHNRTILIASKNSAQEIRKVVEAIKTSHPELV